MANNDKEKALESASRYADKEKALESASRYAMVTAAEVADDLNWKVTKARRLLNALTKEDKLTTDRIVTGYAQTAGRRHRASKPVYSKTPTT